MAERVFALDVVFLLICTVLIVHGQGSAKKYFASSEDLPFVRCSVCQRALKHIRQQAVGARNDATSKGKMIEEDEILSIIEASCNPDKKQGDWISRYDIIESSDGLILAEQESTSRCKQECKTIAKACEESIGEIDTDLGELLWKDSLSLSKLINKVCYEMTDACTKKIQKFKPGKRKDEVFKPMSEDEKKAFDVMKQMKSVPGMPGMEMYSRDEIAKMQEQVKESSPDGGNQKKDETPEGSEELNQSTNLGFLDMVKASFGRFYAQIKNMFSFGNKKSEL